MAKIELPSPKSISAPLHSLADTTPSTDQIVLQTLSQSPHDLLLPTPTLQTALRLFAKRHIDPLAESVSATQQARAKAITGKKRKRSAKEEQEARTALRLKRVHLEGFDTEQVWEQARIVLTAAVKEVEQGLGQHQERIVRDGRYDHERPTKCLNGGKAVHFADEEPDSLAEQDLEDLEDDELRDGDVNGVALDDDNFDETVDNEDAYGDEQEPDIEEIEEEDSDLDFGDGRARAQAGTMVKDKHGLNDGFFSIDDFNHDTEFLETQDAKGASDDGAASDEEEVDWTVDPMAFSMGAINGKPQDTDGKPERRRPKEDPSSSDDDGPTFGDADLNAPFSDDEDGDLGMDDALEEQDDGTNTNEIRYGDFFAPPARPASISKRRRPLPKTQPPPADLDAEIDEPTEADIQRTMTSVRRDIFGSSSPSGSPEPSRRRAGRTNAHGALSTHERNRAAIAAQIRELEAAAVAQREWVLAGEARAADRPKDSLLDATLDFERAGKPLPPPTTAADTASFEELVKARIRERRFDEVRKRRPDATALDGAAAAQRRGLLADAEGVLSAGANGQPRRGLADEYEEAPTGRARAAKDAATQAAHDEVRSLWADLSKRLDALCSLNYRPAPPALEVRVVTDQPRVAMEDARPGVAGALGAEEASGLAPQEVYRVGNDGEREAGLAVTKGGGVVSREEMTREDKRRRRRREKERMRKRGETVEGPPPADAAPANGAKDAGMAKGKPANGAKDAGMAKGKPAGSRKAAERKKIMDQLKGAKVKVIGRDGAIKDVEGREAAIVDSRGKARSGAAYKL